MQQTDLIERGTNAAPGLALTDARNDQRQRNVVENRSIIEQPVILENHADLAAIGRDLATSDTPRVLSVDDNLAARRTLDQRDQSQQRGFSGARMSRDERHLALVDRQAQTG